MSNHEEDDDVQFPSSMGGYDPFAYGRSLGIPGLMGVPGWVYATSMAPVEEYARRVAAGEIKLPCS